MSGTQTCPPGSDDVFIYARYLYNFGSSTLPEIPAVVPFPHVHPPHFFIPSSKFISGAPSSIPSSYYVDLLTFFYPVMSASHPTAPP